MNPFNTVDWVHEFDLSFSNNDLEAKFCWIDLETTGLDPAKDVILEFGMVLTDAWGGVIFDSAFSTVISEPNSDHFRSRIDGMADNVREMHTKSGLLAQIESGQALSVNSAQAAALNVLRSKRIKRGSVYLAGSSVHFDEGFLSHYMPEFSDHLHYRQVNVSTLKVLCQEVNPELYERIYKYLDVKKAHRSMSDLGDSINEYKQYLESFLYF